MSHPLELEDLVPGTHLGHYVITERIAQGGMGTVFKALEPALERYVAIKVLRPEYASNANYVQYFQEEARAVAALRHPNIIPIFYIGQEGNVVFFSMAYIEGETFDDYIETKRWFNEERAKWFLSHAIAALHSAHKANIVHLDIKPANFLVDRSNNIMLTDFGLAQKIVKEGENVEREAFGTPAYVSPEQITRSATDQRTDIYSLGATLFHLMTGSAPFDGPTVEDIVWGHLEKPFPMEIARNANVPTGWMYLLKKMMERKPEDRFSDYRELRTALENVHNFRYETSPLEVPITSKPLSIPRIGADTQMLHGLLAADNVQWGLSGPGKDSKSIQLSRKQVDEAMKNRAEPLKVQALVSTIRDLCHPRADDPEALAEAMEKIPGYDHAIRALVDFMVNPEEDSERAINQNPIDLIETIGSERAHSLALTFFALNYEWSHSTNFDWIPLWRHQITVGIVIDFLSDALNLRRNNLEYAAGAFHDIGKLILGELFPFAYFTVMKRSLSEEISLVVCEKEMFGMTHAEIGAAWLKDQGMPPLLIETVAQHETVPEEVNRRALLTHALISANHLVKQIGIGYSGNCLLDSRPWEELPSTGILWEARGNKEYEYGDFTQDILEQFQNFPDLI